MRVHELDAARARGEVKPQWDPRGTSLRQVRPGPTIGFLLFGLRHGMARIPRIHDVVTFGDGATLDLPGSPRVIHVAERSVSPASAGASRPALAAIWYLLADISPAGRPAPGRMALATGSRIGRNGAVP